MTKSRLSSTDLKTTYRRFRLLDAMVLTGAVAVAMALQRWTWSVFEERGGWNSIPFSIGSTLEPHVWIRAKDSVVLLALVAWAYVAVLAPTLLLLRLIPPKPSRSRMMRQPGHLACVALTVFIGFQVLDLIAREILPMLLVARGELDSDIFRNLVFEVFYNPWLSGLLVAVAWATPALGGWLRTEPTWIDRAGRILGFYALACVPLSWLLSW